MLAFHNRMAELWFIRKNREWTLEEKKEMKICMDANMNRCRKIQEKKNLSLLASMTNDVNWQHEICSDIEELETN